MGATVKVYAARSIGLIRKGLGDTAPLVVDHALGALGAVDFVDALDPVLRIFRDTADERVRVAALEGIGRLRTPAAAVVLIEAVRQETGAVRATAEAQLKKLSGDEMSALVRQARDAEIGDRREILDRVLRALR
jgi:HEAT repeat protein